MKPDLCPDLGEDTVLQFGEMLKGGKRSGISPYYFYDPLIISMKISDGRI